MVVMMVMTMTMMARGREALQLWMCLEKRERQRDRESTTSEAVNEQRGDAGQVYCHTALSTAKPAVLLAALLLLCHGGHAGHVLCMLHWTIPSCGHLCFLSFSLTHPRSTTMAKFIRPTTTLGGQSHAPPSVSRDEDSLAFTSAPSGSSISIAAQRQRLPVYKQRECVLYSLLY